MGFFRLVCVGGPAQGGESGNKERVQSGLDLEETLKSWEPRPGNHVRGDWREQSARDSLHAPQMPSSQTSGSHASQKASMALSKAPMSFAPYSFTNKPEIGGLGADEACYCQTLHERTVQTTLLIIADCLA